MKVAQHCLFFETFFFFLNLYFSKLKKSLKSLGTMGQFQNWKIIKLFFIYLIIYKVIKTQ